MEKTTDRLYLNPETREKIQAILELDGHVELELISKMGLDGMSSLAQQKKEAAGDDVTSGSAKGTTSGSAKGATSKSTKGTTSSLPKGVTSGSAKGTTSSSAKGTTSASGSTEEVIDEEGTPGSCILTQFTPLQLVAKRPGHKIPTVIWESKLKHSSRSVRPLRRFY